MSKRHFEVGAPMRQTVNAAAADKAEMDQAAELLAEKLAPVVAKLLEGEGKAPATNGSNGRKIPDAYQPPADDHWQSYDLNEPIGDEPPRYTPTDGYELPD